MPDSQLLEFIQQQRAAGVADSAIKASLQQAGWDSANIQAAFTGTLTPLPGAGAPSSEPTNAVPLSIIQKILLSLTDPMKLFQWAVHEPQGSFWGYTGLLIALNVAIMVFVRLLGSFQNAGLPMINGGMMYRLTVSSSPIDILFSAGMGVAFSLFGLFVMSGITFILCRIVKGAGSYSNTIKVLVYSAGALMVVQIISTALNAVMGVVLATPTGMAGVAQIGMRSVVGMVIGVVLLALTLWTVYSMIRGLSYIHSISKGRAAVAIVLPMAFMMLGGILFVAFSLFNNRAQSPSNVLFNSKSILQGLPSGSDANDVAETYCQMTYPVAVVGSEAHANCVQTFSLIAQQGEAMPSTPVTAPTIANDVTRPSGTVLTHSQAQTWAYQFSGRLLGYWKTQPEYLSNEQAKTYIDLLERGLEQTIREESSTPILTVSNSNKSLKQEIRPRLLMEAIDGIATIAGFAATATVVPQVSSLKPGDPIDLSSLRAFNQYTVTNTAVRVMESTLQYRLSISSKPSEGTPFVERLRSLRERIKYFDDSKSTDAQYLLWFYDPLFWQELSSVIDFLQR